MEKHCDKVVFEFSDLEIKHFKEACYFNEDEELALEFKMRGKSNQQIADAMGVSLPTANRRIKSMKKKILRVLK